MTGSERAVALFEEGYNCAQAVLGAFSDELGLTREQALAIACPFGGGIGRTRETCGALSGLLMVCGLVSGGEDKTKKTEIMEKTRALIDAFRAETGSPFCRDLLGLETGTPCTPPSFGERPCPKLVALAAEFAEQMLEEM